MSTVVSGRVDDETAERVDEIATERDQSVSATVAELVKRGVETDTAGDDSPDGETADGEASANSPSTNGLSSVTLPTAALVVIAVAAAAAVVAAGTVEPTVTLGFVSVWVVVAFFALAAP